jgi:dethiobiotin synthetase
VKAVFVTGTDTGCGKTTVACALARDARAAGLRVRVLKPVETGCEPDAADARALAEAAGDDRPLDALCPYRLALPAAPEIAARHESVELDLERVAQAFEAATRDADLVVVEGAGGLLVPITASSDMADLVSQLRLPVLLVARASLGTINHTRLSLEAAAARGLDVVALVFSHTTPALSRADRANLDLLEERPDLPPTSELAHGAASLGEASARILATLPGG